MTFVGFDDECQQKKIQLNLTLKKLSEKFETQSVLTTFKGKNGMEWNAFNHFNEEVKNLIKYFN